MALVTGRVLVRRCTTSSASYVRYSAYVIAYAAILTDPFPPFNGDAPYAVAVEIDAPVPQNRLTVLFRAVLVLPCIGAPGLRARPAARADRGRLLVRRAGHGARAAGLQRVGLWILRFRVRLHAYVLLVNPRYPSFGGDPAAGSLPVGSGVASAASLSRLAPYGIGGSAPAR